MGSKLVRVVISLWDYIKTESKISEIKGEKKMLEKVKEIAKLHDKKYRKINNKFLAVGKHLVEEALKKNLVLELFLLEGTPNTYGFDA